MSLRLLLVAHLLLVQGDLSRSHDYVMSREQLTQEVEQLKNEKASLETRIAALESKQPDTGKKVAFLARLSDRNVPSNVPIRFAAVVFNMGNAFDPYTGVFTIPRAGVYIITFQMFPNYGGGVLVDLYKNEKIEVRLRVYDASISTSEASSVTQHCQRGDRYWLQVNRSGDTHSNVHTFLSAALIFADE